MNSASTIPPYWSRFGSFFLYPLSFEPLLFCVAIGGLTGLSSLLFLPITIVLLLVLLVASLRYGYKVLERTARGNLDDGLANIDRTSGGKNRPYKQFVVIAIGLTITGYAASIGGPHLAMVLLVLFALLLPANTMLLALTDDLGDSIAPPRLWEIMHGIGLPYLGLCACLLLLSSSSSVLLGWLVPIVPKALVGAVGGFVSAYFIIVMFRLMGYALYQYHGALGFAVDVGFEGQADAQFDDPEKRQAAACGALLRAGEYAAAIALLRSDLSAKPGDAAANLRLHRLLLAVPGEEQSMLAHAGAWLPELLRAGKYRQAVDVIEAIWQQCPDYRLTIGADCLPLAQAMFDARRYESAARLIKGFDRSFPGHADIPAIYLFGARLLIEHRRDEAQARRVLAAVRHHFPESGAASEALKLTALLDRLAGAA